MQTQTEIRAMLQAAGLHPQRQFGQNFLIDKNLMAKLLELAGDLRRTVVLEVGPGTGSLTEELLDQARRVVAVEIDRGLCRCLRLRFANRENFTLICGDVLAGKHAIQPEVTNALGPRATVVANLPYSIATPLLAECFVGSWRAIRNAQSACVIDSMTVTVQSEVADRILAKCNCGQYGPISVLVSLLAKVVAGPAIPAQAFWPRPKVASRMLRLNFDPQAAERLSDIDALVYILRTAFGQRRKQIGSIARSIKTGEQDDHLTEAIEAAGVDSRLRAEQISPEAFASLANCLSSWSNT